MPTCNSQLEEQLCPLGNQVNCTSELHESAKISTSELHEFNSKALVIIMSDSDSAFKGNDRNEDQNFQKILSDNNAVLEPVKLNDHHALGVIDVFAKNLNFFFKF